MLITIGFSTITFFSVIFTDMTSEKKSWVYLIVLSLIWGSSFILMKKGMYTSSGEIIFSNNQVAALRMIIATIVLLPFAVYSLRKIKSFRTFVFLAIVGVCGNFLPAFLFTYAVTGISSGYTGMLNSFTPIFAILIGVVVFKEKMNSLQYLGIIVGTVGIVLLMLAGSDLTISGNATHLFAVVLATFCYGVSLNVIKNTLSNLKSFEITSLSFLIVLLPSVIIGLKTGVVQTMQENEFAFQGLIYIAILSIVGTALALIIFNKLVAISTVVFTSSVTYLIPVVAMLIGIYFGEIITFWQIASMLVILLGVFITNYLGKKKVKVVGSEK